MVWGAYRAKVELHTSRSFFSSWSVRKKLLVSLIPSVLIFLVITGFATNWYASRYLVQALERTSQIQNLAQAREIERVFEYFRVVILDIAAGSPQKERVLALVRQFESHYPGCIKEVAYVATKRPDSYLYIYEDKELHEIAKEQYAFIRNSPLSMPDKMHSSGRGIVLLSEMTESVYPVIESGADRHSDTFNLFRMTTPMYDTDGIMHGYIVLGLNSHKIRNILSLFNSSKSPLYAFPRTSEQRFSFLFNDQGWMLMQSENLEEESKQLSIETARSGMTGDYGMPDYDKAFRPSVSNVAYWKMVVAVQSGVQGVDGAANIYDSLSAGGSQHYIAYSPIRFRSNPDKEPEILGGIAYIDKSRLTDAAEFRQLDVMTIITILAMALISGVIFYISRILTMPVKKLTDEIVSIIKERHYRTIQLPEYDKETTILKDVLNDLMLSIVDQKEQIRVRDEQINDVKLSQKVSFDDEASLAHGWRLIGEVHDLIGTSQHMQQLRLSIKKAAGTEADVLIVGETGTGKELTAEGIHKYSSRCEQPFISINCGGLDENLLLDTLFGHVKGAFSEARTDRKGAFIASDGGTLFLDEIGTASDKVQKALLRALSVRRIRPLGSDNEIEFNARVIAATNVDLLELVHLGRFRDDLYYRLKVITIQTPSLQQRQDDIPILANHFINESCIASKKAKVGLTRGALEKLVNYDWPGNVRELKNCITRAVAFTEREILYAEDLVFDDHIISPHMQTYTDSVQSSNTPTVINDGSSSEHFSSPKTNTVDRFHEKKHQLPVQQDDLVNLTDRQKIALSLAKEYGQFSRSQFQEAVGASVSQRSAQYDLKVLVSKDILVRIGKGPSTLYTLPK